MSILFQKFFEFLSTLSLRRATRREARESIGTLHFYPRSPCGERRWYACSTAQTARFLSTLSLRRATMSGATNRIFRAFLSTLSLRRATSNESSEHTDNGNFYPRSPCGERHCTSIGRPKRLYFYPRSPCGERPTKSAQEASNHRISIHALLAESDSPPSITPAPSRNFYPRSPCGERRFGSARLASSFNFYPRSPCGERHGYE